MAKHAETSSNLAALSLHVTRMLRDLVHDLEKTTSKKRRTTYHPESSHDDDNNPRSSSQLEEPDVALFSARISLVAKARATAGALQLLRLLCHPVIVQASRGDPATASSSLREALMYHTRGDLPCDQPAGFPLMHSLLDLVAVVGRDKSAALATPEVYDATVFAFQLLLVLCSTQLYQPFQSSFEHSGSLHYILEEMFRHDVVTDGGGEDVSSDNHTDNLRLFWSSNRSVNSHGSSHSSKRKAKGSNKQSRQSTNNKRRIWTPRNVLETCLGWQLDRPPAPSRSMAHMYFVLAQMAVTHAPQGGGGGAGETPGPDGMYESYMVVQATAPQLEFTGPGTGSGGGGASVNEVDVGGSTTQSGHNIQHSAIQPHRSDKPSSRNSLILDATRGVLTISGAIILLPFRLMSLVIGVLTNSSGGRKKGSAQEAMMKKFVSAAKSSRTRDVLWLSDSILSDLGCSLVLLLANNNRNTGEGNALNKYSRNGKERPDANPFRTQLKDLADNRWEDDAALALPDLPNFEGGYQASFTVDDMEIDEPRRYSLHSQLSRGVDDCLTLNFESLFTSFGRTLHTEVGALLLYTLLQSSPAFAESLAVRSDLDTLVLPLLRTLYFSSRANTYMAKDYASKGSSKNSSSLDIRSCPFRSQSQLYVIIILLLLFSQDVSFGRDAFRRITVQNVVWYKERQLKNINLGSILLLTLMRSLLFNLNRMLDGFLLSNCCAVLMNLSPAVADLHEYTSMRLASVTVTLMKKHAKLAAAAASTAASTASSGGELDIRDPAQEVTSPLDMYAEVSHTLLGIVKQGVAAVNVEGDLHLIYALVYHQMDLVKLCKNTNLYKSRETARIIAVTLKASALIQEEGARSAPKALKVLETNLDELKAASMAADDAIKSPSKRKKHHGNNNNAAPAATAEDAFTFTYEEEQDPEVFFLPYVWEVIVCVVTASTMDWRKDDIRAFALLDEIELVEEDANGGPADKMGTGNFSKEADEMV